VPVAEGHCETPCVKAVGGAGPGLVALPGVPGWCRRQPRKHMGPVPVHPWQRAWFMARDPGFRGETRLRHRPGLILTPAVPHTWASPGLGQVFFYRSGL